MPHGNGQHYMVVNKTIRDATKVEAGSRVRVTEYVTWIEEAKKPETRRSRRKIGSRLKA